MQAAIDAFFFEADRLDSIAREHRDDYTSARPFPHVVLHDLVPREALRPVMTEFPAPGAARGAVKDKPYEKKRAYRVSNTLGPHTRHLLGELNSGVFLTFLEQLSGIAGLVADPHLSGGGLHQIERGGLLSIHADFNVLSRVGLDRRLNLLLYLNDDWDDAWGGHLELWPPDMSGCVKRIAPTLGTCVIFNTLSDAFHGHPEPLDCPPDRTRNSIALYYYSSGGRDSDARRPHATLWQRRPGERIGPAWKQWVPPAAIDVARRVRRRGRPTRE